MTDPSPRAVALQAQIATAESEIASARAKGDFVSPLDFQKLVALRQSRAREQRNAAAEPDAGSAA